MLLVSVSYSCVEGEEEEEEGQVDLGSGTTRMDVMDQVVLVPVSSSLPTEFALTFGMIPKPGELSVVVLGKISEVFVGLLRAVPLFPIPAQNPPVEL